MVLCRSNIAPTNIYAHAKGAAWTISCHANFEDTGAENQNKWTGQEKEGKKIPITARPNHTEAALDYVGTYARMAAEHGVGLNCG